MATFTTRVLLHGADRDDYETLHQHMAAKGFFKTITSTDGTVYELPDAEYNYDGNATASEVLDKAQAAAKATGLKAAVLVTESVRRSFVGLSRP